MTKLDIKYDPEVPFDWVAMEKANDLGPKPRFPYDGGGVTVLGLRFTCKHIHTGGSDPYAGDRWKMEVGNRSRWYGQLTLVLDSVVICILQLEWCRRDKWRNLLEVREYELKKMPWFARKLWCFLDRRKDWWMANTPQDEYGCPGNYV
jgi:hypothetical protein